MIKKALYSVTIVKKILCLQCRTFHDRIPLTKGHVIIDSHSEGHGIFKPKPVCTIHKMDFFQFAWIVIV